MTEPAVHSTVASHTFLSSLDERHKHCSPPPLNIFRPGRVNC